MNTKFKIGGVAGKFKLFHKGHEEYIIKSTMLCEKLYIFIADDDNINRTCNIEQTKGLIQSLLLKNKIDIEYEIHVMKNVPLENVEDYFINVAGSELVMFNSKEDYKNIKLKNFYIKCSKLAMSASKLEKNPYDKEHFHLISDLFKPYLNKKVVISGTESCGKTQIARKLSQIGDTAYSEEVGRYYSDEYLLNNEKNFQPKDFVQIAMEQIVQDKKINLQANRYLVCDTDPFVTLRFLKSYRDDYIGTPNEFNETDYQNAYYLLEEVCKSYKADVIFLLKPNVKYVQDGTRKENITEEYRLEQYENLKSLYTELNPNLKLIEVDSDDYYERYLIIENHIENNILV